MLKVAAVFQPLFSFLFRRGRNRVWIPVIPFSSTRTVGSSPSADIVRIRVDRLMPLLWISPNATPLLRRCILDTGAFLSVFPQEVWINFAAQITWLVAADGGTLPTWLTSVGGIGGGGFPCDLGIIEIQVIDTDDRSLPPMKIVAKFAHDGSGPNRLRDILLGLNFFTGHRMELLYDDRGAWLSPR
jgi:hypothetical protein